jgi:gamma-glutamyltranspeptidase/glutathione hydrolase
VAKGWAVAAGSRLAAESAAEALRAGGGAVDAAVAAAFAACAAEPVLASPFGGGFAMAREPGAAGRTTLLDFFAQTPRRKRPGRETDLREIHADFGGVRQRFHIGAGTVACPGFGPGLRELHARGGRIPLPELAQPAAAAAARGAAVEPFQAHVMAVVSPILTASPEAAALYAPDGGTLAAGARLANPELGDLLDALAREDPRFMTHGEPAEALAELCAPAGHLTREDLRAYRPRWREPERIERRGWRVALNPPPAAGGALIGFALALAPPGTGTGAGTGAGAEALARALRATAEARAEAGLDEDPQAGAAALADPATVARWRDRLAGGWPSRRGTTHVSVVDPAGGACALTLSNGEGCGLIAPGTGAMPNNMLGEDDLVAEPGRWPEDRRLASMMAPSLVEPPEGGVAALGSGGSNRIRSAMAQALVHLIDHGRSLEAAVAAPRLHVEGGRPPTLDFEDRFSERERAALLRLFPEARPWPEDSLFFGGVHAARRDRGGGVEAAADPRRGGVALTG